MSDSIGRQDDLDLGRTALPGLPGLAGFLCDEMLQGLGRWLRAAGHDTAIVRHGVADNAVIERALRESRLLLTCDRALAGRRTVQSRTVVLPAAGLDTAARALGDELGIDWLYAPFTRCLLDNAPLAPASETARAALPPKTRELPGPIRSCPHCARLYWPGSHVRRMMARLEAWQLERAKPAVRLARREAGLIQYDQGRL